MSLPNSPEELEYRSQKLREVDLFSDLTDEEILHIARVSRRFKYRKNEYIVQEENPHLNHFFLIFKGEAKVSLNHHDGNEVILAFLEEGDFFGEMSLLDGEPRSANVKASVPTEVLVVHRDDFMKQLNLHTEITKRLLIHISQRLRKANSKIGSLAFLSVCGRIASTLLDLIENRGQFIKSEKGDRIIVIPNRPNNQEIAHISGTTRESVSRALQEMQRKGIISLAGKDLVVFQHDEIQEMKIAP